MNNLKVTSKRLMFLLIGIFLVGIVYAIPHVDFTSPTLDDATTTSDTSIEINVSITNASDLDEVIYNWDGTNYTMMNDSLVLMYNFDNVSGIGEAYTNSDGSVIVDVSNGGNNGTLYVGADNSGNYTTGKYDGAYNFDGVDDYVNIGNLPEYNFSDTSNFTISAWFKRTETETQLIVSKSNANTAGGGYHLSVDNVNRVSFMAYNGTSNSEIFGGGPYNDGNWHHATAIWTHDNSRRELYVDGILIDSVASSAANPSVNSYDLTIGIRASTKSHNIFNGSIDEVMIWNRSLSADEIYQQYVSNLNKYDTDKWALYVNQSKNATDGLDEDTYTYQAFAKDNAGNWNETEQRSVVVDAACISTLNVDSSTIINDAAANVTSYDCVYIQDGGTLTLDVPLEVNHTMIVYSGGFLTHSENIASKTNYIDISVAGNFTIESGGLINISGKGYSQSNGPGVGTWGQTSVGGAGGAGYGGKGGDGNSGIKRGGNSYGNYSQPDDLGSCGGHSGYGSYYGGPGGGNIKINATGVINVTGQLIVNGEGGTGYANRAGGGGSGGGVLLVASDVLGSGLISSNGGEGNLQSYTGGGGSGGRIAIIVDDYTFSGSVESFGGNGPLTAGTGSAGTIYVQSDAEPNGGLIIDNDGSAQGDIIARYNAAGARLHPGTHTFDSITIRNKGNLEIHNNSVLLNLISTNVIGDGGVDSVITNNGNITVTTNYTISNWTLALNNGSIINNLENLTIANGGILTHSYNFNVQTYSLNISLNQLNIESDGYVYGDAKGYSSNYGPETGRGGWLSNGAGGAGYGGEGGTGNSGLSGGSTYGSIISPTVIGSAGAASSTYGGYGGRGGGVIFINATKIILDGEISSEGSDGTPWANRVGGGGAGGSIYLNANNISGNGEIKSGGGSGADQSGSDGGGGGGGRIAFYSQNYEFTGSVSAYGGNGPGAAEHGGAGTIYIANSTIDYGALTIDNNDVSTPATTFINATVTDRAIGSLAIRNEGHLKVSNTELTVYGDWNRTDGDFTADTNSTIVFAGDSTQNSTIYSNETFYNLNITKKGSYVLFPVGLTNVSNSLAVLGNFSHNSFLRSITEGVVWELYQSDYSVAYADVRDSNNTGSIIYADTSTDSGNNFEWNFDQTAPVVTLISPIDNSGTNENVTFNYNVADEDNVPNCSLIFDGTINQTNTTITKDITQNFTINNLEVGSYSWSVNCTDDSSNIGNSETRTFGVVKNNDFSGSTTDLTQITIGDISNLVFENPSFGMVNFSENVDLSAGADVDGAVNISENRIEVNSSALAVLNKSATLKLYNLTFTDPQILKDGELCSSTVCIEENYSGGTLIFNVTGFSVYSARETPSSGTGTPSGGGSSEEGGGGTSVECTKDENCEEGYSCYGNKCVKLFDVEILGVGPLIESLDFELKYLIKGMAEIEGDVIVKFWIERRGEKVILGQDTIYVGSFEKKTKTTKLNLPYDVLDEVYDLYVQVNYENYHAESFRKINIKIPEEVKSEVESRKDSFRGSGFKLVYLYVLIGIIILAVLAKRFFESEKRSVKDVEEHIEVKKRVDGEVKTVKKPNSLSRAIKKIKIPKVEMPSFSLFGKIFDKSEQTVFPGGQVLMRGLLNKKVYSNEGDYVGKIKQPVLLNSGFYGWVIGLGKEHDFDRKVLVRQRDVLAIEDIFIIKGDVKKSLKKLKSEEEEFDLDKFINSE